MTMCSSPSTELRSAFSSGITRGYEWRKGQISALVSMVKEHEAEWIAAVSKDVGKPALEVESGEILSFYIAAQTISSGLKSWMNPRPHSLLGLMAPGSCQVRFEPLGVILIIGPFNFPLGIVIKPVLGAIAAGNCVVIKPSEHCPATAEMLARLVPKYLDARCFRVVLGGVPETTKLLSERFDHILFTGSTRVGRVVARAAAERLTPCTLELGGKNPVVVGPRVDSVVVAARRVAWGRTINAGQVCLSPEYVVCLEEIAPSFEEALIKAFADMYGPEPARSPDLGRLISAAAVRRVHGAVTEAVSSGKVKIILGGQADPEARYMSPTVVRVIDPTDTSDCPLMQEESFGPVLALVRVKTLDEAVEYVRRVSGDHPLALYVFSNNRTFQEECMQRIQSGAAVINDVVVHNAVPNMPFGGVGNSGMGQYGGRYGFERFSHQRAVLFKYWNWNNAACDPPIRYAPATPGKTRLLRFVFLYLPQIPPLSRVLGSILPLLPVAIVLAVLRGLGRI